MPATAPSFADVVNVLIQHNVDTQIMRVEREEEEEACTPSPTGLQPGVHPGPGWHANFEEAAIHHVFQIPSDDPRRYEITPFVMIDWNSTSPELLGTWGQGCPVHAQHLHAHADEFPHPAFDWRQEFFFADNQTHSEGIDWAVEQEGDITLHAKIVRHRVAHAKVARHARQVTDVANLLLYISRQVATRALTWR